jgi:hypothetical protein
MRTKRMMWAVAIAAVGLGLASASAGANERATIGSDLPKPDGYGFGCGDGDPGDSCLWVQSSLPADNPHRLKAPFDGVITRFRYRKDKDESAYPIRLQVGRQVEHVPPGQRPAWRFTDQSRRVMAGAEAGIYGYRVHVPIKKGQSIGVLLHGRHASNQAWTQGHGFFFDPAPIIGESLTPNAWVSEAEYLWNATIKRR